MRIISINLIIDLSRNLPLETELETVEAIADLKHLGVIGIGLGGPERDFPPGLFEMAFNRARDIGLHVTAHAGEAAGFQSIWEAINQLHVERIGHASHAYEDMRLIEHLAAHNIPVELCPISNIRTKVIDTIADHPIRRFYDAGMALSVNTDDPKLFNTSLAGEYRALIEHFGMSREDIRCIIKLGIESSWLPDNDKRRLISEFMEDQDWR